MVFKVVSIKDEQQNVNKVEFESGEILYLIGTAHISKESEELVGSMIETTCPDVVAVELDPGRLEVLRNRKRYEQTDIFEIFRNKKVLFFTAQLLLSGYQKKIAEKTGVSPGSEFKKAVVMAESKGAKIVTADRDISITLKRTIRSMSLTEKVKFLCGLFFSNDKNIDRDSIEELKKGDMLMQLIGEMSDEFPSVKKFILDERDIYLATSIVHNLGKTTVAVVGAAHVPGILEYIKGHKVQNTDLSDIEYIPKPSKIFKVLSWVIPIFIFGMFIRGFFTGGSEVVGQALVYWILINGILSALGCILARGHVVTVLVGFVAAPITSLNPTIGAGIVTGLTQLYLVKPLVKDLENVSGDTVRWKDWKRNRLTRALLVSLFSAIGSLIGTIVAFPFLIKILL